MYSVLAEDEKEIDVEEDHRHIPTKNQVCITTQIGKIRKMLRVWSLTHLQQDAQTAILIGSQAMPLKTREPKDWDLISTTTFALALLNSDVFTTHQARAIMRSFTPVVHILTLHVNHVQYEINLALHHNGYRKILNLHHMDKTDVNKVTLPHFGIDIEVANPQLLYLLKRSHIYWPHNFEKHIEDLHILKSLSKPFSNLEQEILNFRIAEKESYHGNPARQVNLNKSNDEFFQTKIDVTRHIFHDHIHELVKIGDIPLYRRLQTDPGRAWAPESKFLEFTLEERLNDVREEAMVLAIERFILPRCLSNSQEAYAAALIKICTSTTKGYFREFAIDHWQELKTCPTDLIELLQPILNKLDTMIYGEDLMGECQGVTKHEIQDGNILEFNFFKFWVYVYKECTTPHSNRLNGVFVTKQRLSPTLSLNEFISLSHSYATYEVVQSGLYWPSSEENSESTLQVRNSVRKAFNNIDNKLVRTILNIRPDAFDYIRGYLVGPHKSFRQFLLNSNI
ncbi:MAG: hypothetical protein Sylvanvirus37_3 [Sylvanvirus sp.]|uniref:DUF7275 domain-containing protein n=1 Tax=Sylvanvirus sp. TaxID=2487774 RepID=A0A3G5AJ90_9VIRU|nr:MAG: hypothetical protein Sylvanvirus37_3 [Sylvanvirus sp.]